MEHNRQRFWPMKMKVATPTSAAEPPHIPESKTRPGLAEAEIPLPDKMSKRAAPTVPEVYPGCTDGVDEVMYSAVASNNLNDINATVFLGELRRDTLTNTPAHVARPTTMNMAAKSDLMFRIASSVVKSASTGPVPPSIEVYLALTASLGEGSLTKREEAAKELRRVSKISAESRMLISRAGAVPILLSILQKPRTDAESVLVEHVVTVCYNLSMESDLAKMLVTAGGIPPLLAIANTDCSAQLNATGTISNLSTFDSSREEILNVGGVPVLIHLATNSGGTGFNVQRDAIVALFNLAINDKCRSVIVSLNLIPTFLQTLLSSDASSDASVLEEEIALLLSSLLKAPSSIDQALANDGIPALSSVLSGAPRAQAHAAAGLLLIAKSGKKALLKVKGESIIPELVRMEEEGTPRGREKAAALLKLLRE